MKARLAAFKGAIPKLNARDIPPGVAAVSLDARFDDGCIVPVNGSATAHTFDTAVGSIVYHNETWRGFAGDVDAAPGPVAADRLYLTGDGVPQMFVEGVGQFDLKLQSPPTKLTATAAGTVITVGSLAEAAAIAAAGDGETPAETAADDTPNPSLQSILYVYTYVTVFDEESAPSPTSDPIDWQSGQTVTVTGFDEPTIGRNIDRIRVYRSQTSALGVTDLYFVYEMAVTQSQYIHDLADDPLAEFITSRDYDQPPDTLTGIVSFPNGIMAGFTGRTLRFSEPFIPHAWPIKYELKTDYEIVGLAVFGLTLCVMTKGTPYMVQGQTPDTMVMQQMEMNLPCMSARSIVDLGYAVAYASHRGLVIMSQSGPQMVTTPLYTRNQWVALQPDTFRAAQVDGKYLFTSATGTYIINLQSEIPFVEGVTLDAISLWYDITTGLLFGLSSDGLTVKTFDDPSVAATANATWSSGTLQLDHPSNFGVVKVAAQSLSDQDYLRVAVYGDDRLVGIVNRAGKVERLASGKLYDKWRVEVESNMKVEVIIVAGTPSEIVQ